ncbi:hypothetical protein QUF74_04575 [Candidatus Halobeggiatoa sp. HSG11]|nr:hypothetical protein [Candidatus Halobeggiatoa sp. HSG11]
MSRIFLGLSSVRRKLIVGGICLGLVFSVPVVAGNNKNSFITGAKSMFSSWVKKLVKKEFVKTRAYSKKVLGIPLLELDEMIITSPKKDIIYLGYLSDEKKFENVSLDDCLLKPIQFVEPVVTTSDGKTVKTKKGKIVYYKKVEFRQPENCAFTEGVHKITIGSSVTVTKPFKISTSTTGCLTEGRYNNFLEESTDYKKSSDEFGKLIAEITWLFKKSPSTCIFEIYQKVVSAQKNDSFNKIEKSMLQEFEISLAANFRP